MCFNAIASLQFWDTIRVEHGLNEEGQYEGDNKLQLERMDVYFNEAEYVVASFMSVAP